MAARMIAERRMNGTIDQIDGVVYFKSKQVINNLYSLLQRLFMNGVHVHCIVVIVI